ncbi:MAG: GntR family transcriptional regulator [Kangiellaceae bacterium]|nr:GntR family transcriptional regulator [Kangiellaceae bacterium]
MPESKIIDLFALNTSSGIPIYRQLVDQIKQAIMMGMLEKGQQLPSVRQLAKALQINPMTISKAFAQLELEKILERRRGVGMLVAQQSKQTEVPLVVSESMQKFIKIAQQHDLDNEAIMLLIQQGLSVKIEGNQS